MIKRIGILAVLSLLVLAVVAMPVLAQNPHFVGALRGTDRGTQLQVSGKVAGLGNEPVNVVVEAEGIATVQCRNPGGNVAPGQDTTVDVEGQSGPIQPRSGQITFNVLTAAPTVSGAEACPNPQWTAEVTDVQFTSATVTVFDLAGNVILGPAPVTIR